MLIKANNSRLLGFNAGERYQMLFAIFPFSDVCMF